MFVTQAGAPDLFILNLGDRNFTTVPIPFTHMEGNCSAAATLDVNGDGLMDLFVTRNGESNFLLINNWDSDGDWLEVRLASTNQIDGAVGARVTLKIGESLQMREVSCGGSPGQDSPTLHFGVVGVATIDTLTVFWGGEQDETILTDVPCNQLLEIDQAQATKKTSPPVQLVTSLRGVYPNPFNPSTTIEFTLAQAGPVKAEVFDVTGRRVALLQNGDLPVGTHNLVWHGNSDAGSPVASGLYYCRLVADDQVFKTKLMLLK